MKLFTANQIIGHYPVGACAIALAYNKEDAKILLEEELTIAGISQVVPLDEIEEVPIDIHKAIVLIDGNY